jgi:hypothetical protein
LWHFWPDESNRKDAHRIDALTSEFNTVVQRSLTQRFELFATLLSTLVDQLHIVSGLRERGTIRSYIWMSSFEKIRGDVDWNSKKTLKKSGI